MFFICDRTLVIHFIGREACSRDVDLVILPGCAIQPFVIHYVTMNCHMQL